MSRYLLPKFTIHGETLINSLGDACSLRWTCDPIKWLLVSVESTLNTSARSLCVKSAYIHGEEKARAIYLVRDSAKGYFQPTRQRCQGSFGPSDECCQLGFIRLSLLLLFIYIIMEEENLLLCQYCKPMPKLYIWYIRIFALQPIHYVGVYLRP